MLYEVITFSPELIESSTFLQQLCKRGLTAEGIQGPVSNFRISGADDFGKEFDLRNDAAEVVRITSYNVCYTKLLRTAK